VALLLSILAEFHRQHLSYCYWRSTRRVSAALSGNSDLDLLIARDAQQRCQTILLSGGFKLFPDTANRLHPALCSYLGYDEPSGRIVHVHVHSHLAVGEALLKNYLLPWEAAILARAALHPTLPIKVLDPADEALLLVARGSLERRRTDPVALRHWTATSRKFELDRQQLRERLEPATLRNRAHAVFADDVADMVVDGIFYGLPLERQSRLQRRIRRELAAYRTFNAVEARAELDARRSLGGRGLEPEPSPCAASVAPACARWRTRIGRDWRRRQRENDRGRCNSKVARRGGRCHPHLLRNRRRQTVTATLAVQTNGAGDCSMV